MDLEVNNDNEENEVDMLSCPPSQASVMESSPGAAGICEETETEEGVDVSTTAYTTDENGGVETTTKSCVLNMIDEMEGRVEKLRADAMQLEAERDEVLTSLDTLNNSQMVHELDGVDLEEVRSIIKRLAQRSATVMIEINTERSPSHQDSLHKVNTLIDTLIREAKSDVEVAKRRCISYMNSCNADEINCGIGIDAIFEAAVLGCTLEDQKRVKKRLNGLYSYFLTYSDPLPSTSASLTQIEEECENSNL